MPEPWLDLKACGGGEEQESSDRYSPHTGRKEHHLLQDPQASPSCSSGSCIKKKIYDENIRMVRVIR
jgi:hypothetical protein